MAAYDNVQMPGSPTPPSYAAPLVDFSPLGDIPKAYYQGQEEQRKIGLNKAFSEGLPRTASGEIDYSGMADTLARKGGVDEAMKVATLGAQMDVGRQVGSILNPDANSNALPPRRTAPVFAPPSRDAQGGGGAQPQQPQLSSAGGDNAGTDSIRSVATEQFGGRDVSAMIPRFAKALGVDPDSPLTPDQVAKARAFMGRTAQATQPTQVAPQGPVSQAPGGAVQPGPQIPAQPPVGPAGGDPTLGGLVPPQWIAEGKTASQYRDVLGAVTANPMAQPGAKAVALERMKAIDAAMAKAGEATPEMKNAQASGVPNPAEYERLTAQNKDEVSRYGKRAEGIAKAGQEAAIELPQLDIAKTIMNDPSFYSGPLEGTVLTYKRLLGTLGADPNVANPQEAFRKIVSNSVLSQVKGLAAAGTGRIMLAEIKIMEKAAANPENTPATNRMLVELSSRLHQHALGLSDLANSYKGGRLDPGFDRAAREWTIAHPLFSKAEIADPRLIAPPIFKTPDDVKKAKLAPGTPFQTPDGRTKYIP